MYELWFHAKDGTVNLLNEIEQALRILEGPVA